MFRLDVMAAWAVLGLFVTFEGYAILDWLTRRRQRSAQRDQTR